MPAPLDAYTDSDRILRQAAATFFDHLSEMCEGIMVVDRGARLVWINDRYERYLSALGFSGRDEVIGRPVEEVVPNTLMRQVVETGRPILLDIIENKAGTYVVSRIPLHDDHGEVIGAVGLVLYDKLDSLKPMLGRMNRLQAELDEAKRELARQRRTRYTLSNYVGASAPALEVKSRARRAAALNTTLLLLGETGTGKELIAQAIHSASARAHKPFIAVNVAAIPETLIEAEFFGVAPGAYTGADRRGRDGKLALADGGTLLLDEIGDMPLAMQAKLLRVLQEREFEPLGSNRVQRVDLRVIAASSVDLGALVASGAFRSDLYYRLNVLPIRLPALRDRPGDLRALAEHLLELIAAENDQLPKEIDNAAVELLAAQPWPGNVRELRNVLERACMLHDGLRLSGEDLRALVPAPPGDAARPASGADPEPSGSRGDRPAPAVPAVPDGPATSRAVPGSLADPAALPPARGDVAGQAALGPASDSAALDSDAHLPLAQRVARLEREAIALALRESGGNRVRAARRLGIARATLYLKLAAYPELSDT